MLRPYRVQVFVSLLLLLLLTAIEMIFPAIIQQVIDVGLKAGHTNFLISAAGLIVALALIKAGGNFAQRYITEWTANRAAMTCATGCMTTSKICRSLTTPTPRAAS